MGFLSNLFGAKEDEGKKALQGAFAMIQKVIEDEEYQLEFVHPMMKPVIQANPAYDRDPKGTGPFGLVETNPIPTNGPVGQIAYLSKLETASGQRLLFHRLGSIGKIDAFEAVSFDGREWFILFVDMYHPRKSRLSPDGLRFTQTLAQFSGFTTYCENFPYDFIEKKGAQPPSPVRLAYIAVSRVAPQLEARVFTRPLAHKAKLDLIRSRLSGLQT
jgi:hypothetical protein